MAVNILALRGVLRTRKEIEEMVEMEFASPFALEFYNRIAMNVRVEELL